MYHARRSWVCLLLALAAAPAQGAPCPDLPEQPQPAARPGFVWVPPRYQGRDCVLVSGHWERARTQSASCPVPVLYDQPGRVGNALQIRDGYDYERLFISDEFGFDDRTASLCVPDGYVLELFENVHYGGEKYELQGPKVLDELRSIQWEGRVSSARSRRVGAEAATAAEPEAAAAATPEAGAASADWMHVARAYQSAERHQDCGAVTARYGDMARYVQSREPVPRDVVRRFDVEATSTSAFARSLMLRLEGQRAECFGND